jgi:hypothetical protein
MDLRKVEPTMSIIHNALKKVQKSMQKNSETPAPTTSSEGFIETLSSTESKQRNPSTPWVPTMVLVILGIAIAFGILQLQKNPSLLAKLNLNMKPAESKPLAQIVTPVKVEQPKAASNSPVATPAPSAIAPVATVTTVATPPVLNVQGIMASGHKIVALINNEIYEEGSFVNGQKILKISMNSLTLEHDGHQEIIPIKK